MKNTTSRKAIVTTKSVSPVGEEFACYLDGQLIGYVAKVGNGLWQVVGMGEQLHPVCYSGKRVAVNDLLAVATDGEKITAVIRQC